MSSPEPIVGASALSGGLTTDQRMLLTLRDELYEGDWDLFETDLRARLADEPHLFEIGSPSPQQKERITSHLNLIAELRTREQPSA